jgi:hypothetical protein
MIVGEDGELVPVPEEGGEGEGRRKHEESSNAANSTRGEEGEGGGEGEEGGEEEDEDYDPNNIGRSGKN